MIVILFFRYSFYASALTTAVAGGIILLGLLVCLYMSVHSILVNEALQRFEGMSSYLAKPSTWA